MKKWIAVLLAAALLCGVACGVNQQEKNAAEPQQSAQETEAPTEAPTPEPTPEPTPVPTPEPAPEPSCFEAILGEWTAVSVEIGGESYDPETVRTGSTLTFFPNGAGRFAVQQSGHTQETLLVFSTEGNTIAMTDEECETQTAVYDPETNTIRMDRQSAMTFVFVPKGEEPISGTQPEDDAWKTAELVLLTDEDEFDMISITVLVPAGCTVTIDFPNQEDYSYTNEGDRAAYRRVKIPIPVFYPNAPVAEAEMTIEPQITMTFPDGTEYNVECPGFTATFPALSLTLTGGVEQISENTYRARPNADGVFSVEGVVSEESARIFIDGVEYPIYMGGVFIADVTAEEGKTEFTLTAEKNNYVSAAATITLAEPPAEPTEEPDADAWRTAELRKVTDDNGRELVAIRTLVPAGCTLTIAFPHQENYTYTNSETEETPRQVRIPVEVYYPNEPLDEEEITIGPKITMTFPDGTVSDVECPDFSLVFPALTLTVADGAEQVSDDTYLAKKNADGGYRITGAVSDPEATILFDGVVCEVSDDGSFIVAFTAEEGIMNYTLRAEKANFVIAETTIVIDR